MTTHDYLLIVEAASVTVGLINLAWHIDRRSRRQPPPEPPVIKPRRSLADQMDEVERSNALYRQVKAANDEDARSARWKRECEERQVAAVLGRLTPPLSEHPYGRLLTEDELKRCLDLYRSLHGHPPVTVAQEIRVYDSSPHYVNVY